MPSMNITTRIRGLVLRGKEYLNSLFGNPFATFAGFLAREGNAGDWQKGILAPTSLSDLTAFSAVFACVSRIAADVSKLCIEVKKRQQDGTYVPYPPESPWWGPVLKPNDFQNRIQFFTYWLVCKALYGNVYILKRRERPGGMVRGFYILDPRRVLPMVTQDGSVYYGLGADDLSEVPQGMTVPSSEIIHDRGATLWHPLIGVSPVRACAMSALQGVMIQSHATRFFQNLSRPSGMLTSPGTIDDVTATRLKNEWQALYSGSNFGKVAVAGDGLEYKPFTMPADDAQLIEQLGWTVEDVARAFQMPLHKINAGPPPTQTNVEALELQYYSGCLQPYIEAIELCLTEGLGMPPGTCLEFDLEGLLRMDSATQIDILTKAVGGALMKPDEARARRNLPPVPGGDSVYMQQQNYSLAALAKRDAKEDPFANSAASSASGPPAATPKPAGDATPPEPDGTPQASAGLLEVLGQLTATLTQQLSSSREHTDALTALVERALRLPPEPEEEPSDFLEDLAAALEEDTFALEVA